MTEENTMFYLVKTNSDGLVIATANTNILMEGYVQVSAEIFWIANANIDYSRLVNGQIEVLPRPEPEPMPYTLQMSDFWSRFLDDDEYGLFDDALSTAIPAKDRRALNSATYLKSDSALFAWAAALLTSVVGEERCSEIMAPSIAGKSTQT